MEFKKVTLKTNSEFAEFLAKELQYHDIVVQTMANGGPNLVKMKQGFKAWILENDPEAKLDDGKSFKPQYPENWIELLPLVAADEVIEEEFDEESDDGSD